MNWNKSYSVNLFCKFYQSPNKTHWTAVKLIMHYLRGTTDAKLTYSKYNSDEIIGYCNAN